jgi:hypothetical protein
VTLPRLAPEQLAFPIPVAGFNPVHEDFANTLLVRWGHKLGPCNRPFNREGWTLDIDGAGPVAVAVSASPVAEHMRGVEDGGPVQLERCDVVELARLCTRPGWSWATRPMIRLWRECAGPRYSMPEGGPPRPLAAVSYSMERDGSGQVYRFDGWTRIATGVARAGGGGPSSRSNPVRKGDPTYGKKSLWLWRYAPRPSSAAELAAGPSPEEEA